MRLFFVLYILAIFCGAGLLNQHDYHLIIERVNITFYNKSYFKNKHFNLYYVTRYSKRLNVSGDLIQNVDANLMIFHLEGRKFQSNEYRLFPFNFSENVCDGFNNKQFGHRLEEFETNFIPTCSIKKGHYYFNNIHYDESKFPPYAPRGRYLLIGNLLYKKNILMITTETHLEIKPQNPLERTIGV